MTPEMWHEQHPVFVTALYDLAVSLGGTISGEHGIGRKRTPHIASILTPPTIAAMQAVRLSMDPQGIMNPGVLLP
jgi:FAD/FMN-containing dehydrogenase